MLPTFLGVSPVSRGSVIGSLAGFVLFYSALAIVDVALMVRAVRQGPPVEEAPPGRHPFAPQRERTV